MKVLGAELVTSASTGGPRAGLMRDDVAQIALCGRSNVGKSSLLNALLGQNLARTSAAAGKTRLANIYRVTVAAAAAGRDAWSVYLVDLPGYGYARGGHESREELAAVVSAYFGAESNGRPPNRQPKLGGVFLLVDSRHPGLRADVEAYRHLSVMASPFIIATKVDKLSRAERQRNLREIERTFEQAPLPVSVTSGEGLDQLWRLISRMARGVEI